MKLSFKKRITLFNTISVAITTVVIFITIYAVVYFTSYRHLDNDILLEKEEVFNNIDWRGDSIIINKMPEWEESEHKQIEVNPTFIQIVDRNDHIVFRSVNLQSSHFLFDPSNTKGAFYNSEINKQRIRQGQFPIYNENKKIIGQLTIGVSQQESYNVLSNLFFTLAISFLIMLFVLYRVISFAASKAIAPVQQLIKTISGINDQNINTRLPLPGNEDEIYQLAASFNELLNRIEKSIQQQKQFTADASHEMRTPITAIRGQLEVLIRKKREPEQYEVKINEVIVQVDRLYLIFDQLLQLSLLESGVAVIRKESIILESLVMTVINKWVKELNRKQIQYYLFIPDKLNVMADPFLLERMVDNLLSNAIKFGHEKGNIFITWDKLKGALSIKDDGPGIAADQLPYLFNRFYRADHSRSSQIQGNGLGLAIVKRLAELQQINISVISTEDKGADFILHFGI